MKNWLLLLLIISSTALANFSAYVINVIDGDTINVLTIDNKKIRIRLVDIDAPERGQPYVNESRQFLAVSIADKTVFIKEQGQDIYHRILGTVYHKSDYINRMMVDNGYRAYRYKNRSSNKTMVNLGSRAKRHLLGLWQDTNPIAPWNFRHIR